MEVDTTISATVNIKQEPVEKDPKYQGTTEENKKSRSRSRSKQKSNIRNRNYRSHHEKKRSRSRSPGSKKKYSRSYSRHSKSSSKRSRSKRSRSRSRSRDKSRRGRDKKSHPEGQKRKQRSSSTGSSGGSEERTKNNTIKEANEDNKSKSKSTSETKEKSEKRSRRSRSRSRGRKRSHERRSSRNERSRKKGRYGKHDKEESRDKDKDAVKDPEKKENNKAKDTLSKDFEQARLEEEMKKRKDRVETWRKEQKLALGQPSQNDDDDAPGGKQWTLDDDDDDDEEEGEREEEREETVKDENGVEDGRENEKIDSLEKMEEAEEDEDDPLDAFMSNLKAENDKHMFGNTTENTSGPKISRVVAVAKKKSAHIKPEKKKGELMEGDADAMEYSSEEEEESLDSALGKFRNKQQGQGRKLDTVIDHSKIQYEDFCKKFYVEVPELAAMTEEEVDDVRMNLEHIKVRGKNCPKPIRTWAQAGVSYKVLNALKKLNFEKPTSIQAQALPVIMCGHDMMGIAKTGSGKTLAFVLPMLRHIMDQRPLEDKEGPIAVIMTPTRELALQITKECKKFTKPMKLKVVCVYGGTGISEQIAELKRGAEIIVCTPGRMIDMLAANSGRVTNMRRCTYLVLDEADRMFDMGFEPQVMHIMNSVRPDRQTVMFSATFPRQMEALARRILSKPIEVQVGGRSVVCSDVTQHVHILEKDQKYFKLLELLGLYQEQGSILVFVDKQEHADRLLKDLMGSSYPCMALHGGIDQYDRDSVINDFKNGITGLLIATSVAARGLDVKNLILVINYDCPNHYEDYVHRCGRTGRAGSKGFAHTFIVKEQARHAGDIIKALEMSGASVSKELESLWATYKSDLTAQGKAVSKNSGFTGRGFKFDETEDELVKERKQFQKAALGLHDSDDESPAKDIDEQIENMFNSKKRVKDVVGPLVLPGAGGESAQGQGGLSGSNIEKLEIAKRLAVRINVKKNLGAEAQDVTQQAATAILKGGPFQAPKVSAKTIAGQLAEKINQKLNYVPQEKSENDDEENPDGQGATFKRYEEELEINDFPQTCRWKVTSKDTLSQISEYSEAGITIRGQYFPSGKQPEEDERKLYLAIEAVSEMAVQKAKNEITRLIKEELIRLQNSYQPINKGRYKVT